MFSCSIDRAGAIPRPREGSMSKNCKTIRVARLRVGSELVPPGSVHSGTTPLRRYTGCLPVGARRRMVAMQWGPPFALFHGGRRLRTWQRPSRGVCPERYM